MKAKSTEGYPRFIVSQLLMGFLYSVGNSLLKSNWSIFLKLFQKVL